MRDVWINRFTCALGFSHRWRRRWFSPFPCCMEKSKMYIRANTAERTVRLEWAAGRLISLYQLTIAGLRGFYFQDRGRKVFIMRQRRVCSRHLDPESSADAKVVLRPRHWLWVLRPFAYLRCTRYLFVTCFIRLPLMCTTGPLFRLTRLLSDLAIISILSSYSPDTSYLPYLPI